MNVDIYQYKKQLLFLSFLGIFLLFFLSSVIKEKELTICKINETKLNTLVEIEGFVSNERMISDKSKILTLKQGNCSIEVLVQTKIFFDDKNIKVIGKVSTYQNKKQITAEKIIFTD
jgi:DNA replicative helicase MCM subunit Mcm2 (Cdc46/Mcm family)